MRFAVVAVSATIGCGPPGDEPAVITRDSAGVAIVESREPTSPGRLMIDTTHTVDIGGGSGTPHAEFLGSVTAARLPNGEVAVAGWTATELRFFDSTGQWVRNVGRAGAGPGEFEALGFVFGSDNGELVTYEPGSRRIQFFSSEGGYLRFALLAASPDAGFPNVIGTLPGGTLLLMTGGAVDSGAGGPLVTNRQAYYRTDPATGRHRRLFETAGPTYIRHPRRPQFRIGVLPFASAPAVVADGAGTLSALEQGFGIEVRDSTGRVVRSLRRAWTGAPVTAADRRQAAVEMTTRTDSAFRNEVREIIAGASVPSHRPAVSVIAASVDGRIFVQHYGSPTMPSREVTVFGPDGRWEQELALPRAARLLKAGPGYVMVTYADDDEFQHVVIYRLVR